MKYTNKMIEKKRATVKALILSAFTVTALTVTATAFAENNRTVGEQASEVGEDAVKNVKKGARAAKDAVCMEGDVECAMQKAESKAKNVGDEVNDKADDVQKSLN